MKKRVVLIVVLAMGSFAGFWVWRAQETLAAAGVVALSGNIEVTDVQMSFKVPGRVKERRASEGQTVKTGDIVAVLDETELSQQSAQAAARLAVAKADDMRATLEFARQKELFEKKVIASREFEMAETMRAVADARVKEAEAAAAVAATHLADCTLNSPIDGVVLAEHVEKGEYVVPGTPVVTVGDIQSAWMRGYVNEGDLGRVKVGQPASVRTDSYPGKVYHGKVSFISSEAEFTPRSVQTHKERVKLVYRVKIDLSNASMELKPGMPADGEIQIP